MRARILALGLWVGLTATSIAIPYIPPPQPVYEAPIDRALTNVAAMEGLDPAQRERVLGRLNLLAYARDNAPFTYMADSNDFVEAGSMLCREVQPMGPRMQEEPREFGPDDRCAAYQFNLGPQTETPTNAPQNPSAGARARLEAARGHYARALEIDRADLRARLGYAYVLDRLGRTNDARRELRTILKRGRKNTARRGCSVGPCSPSHWGGTLILNRSLTPTRQGLPGDSIYPPP